MTPTDLKLYELLGEEWRDIPGYEGFYQASSLGKIRSLDRKSGQKICTWKVLSPWVNLKNYEQVVLNKAGEGKRIVTVHSLILLTFNWPRMEWMVINHIDGNKRNNALSNLEYCTSSENYKHALSTGLMIRKKWKENKTCKTIHQLSTSWEFLKEWHGTYEIERELGIPRSWVSQALVWITKSAWGFIWKYPQKWNL